MNSKLYPLISIITVVYNGAKTLEQTIQGVLNQSYKNIEYIIIDGGSTDGTIDIIKRYEKDISFWISEPDKGLYDAMNKGISYANGELVGMVNSDDWYELNAVERVVEVYQANPKKRIFHGDMFVIDSDNNKKLHKFNPSVFKLKYYGATYNHPTFFVSKFEYEEHIYNISLRSVADIQFTLEAFLNNRKKFQYIDKPLSNFRLNGISGSLSRVDALKEGFIARKEAGFSLPQNILTIGIRIIYWQLSSLIRVLRNNKR